MVVVSTSGPSRSVREMERRSDGATGTVAEWISQLENVALPDAVLHQSRRLLLDYLCAVILGAGTPTAIAILDVARMTYRGDEATVVGGGSLSAPGAALVNGTAAHGYEIDDGYTPGSVHPSAPVLSAVLAVAESNGSDMTTILKAIAAGVELTARVAAAGHPATWRRGFHNTPIAGVFGAAAGCAVLYKLPTAQVASSLGVAGSHAGGLFAFLDSGAEVKRLHAGKAARDGIISVEAAQRGITGPADIFECEKGYFAAFAGGDWKPDLLLDGLGVRWAMLNTYVKPYPCCRHLHGPIDCALQLRSGEGIDLKDLESVTVSTYEIAAHHDHKEVDNILSAQMSIPYAVAAALTYGHVGIGEFAEDRRSDTALSELASRVVVIADPSQTARYPGDRSATLTLKFRSRSTLTASIAQPLGEPTNPLSDEQLRDKFMFLCSPVIGEHEASQVAHNSLYAETLGEIMLQLRSEIIA